ncbi:MAG: glycosyltransferase family 87 protein [Ardenticatenia bacterium]|nr:glycosyltransferase family 87 protein [Ardenticatenia bacterium]
MITKKRSSASHHLFARCFATFVPPFRHSIVRAVYIGALVGFWLAFGIIMLYEAFLYFPWNTVDFAQHYFLGKWVNQGNPVTDARWPYETGIQWMEWMYSVIPYLPYQPLLLPLMRLLATLPYPVAASVWLGGAIFTWWVLARPLATSLGWPTTCVRLSFLCFPLAWFPLYFGNVDIYLSSITIGAVLLFQRGRPLWSGFLWGWIGAFKPPLFFGALPGLRSNPRPFLSGVVLGGLNALGVAYFAVGPEGLLFFGRHFSEYSRETFLQLLAINASLVAWLAAWGGPITPSSRPFFNLQWPVYLLAFLLGTLFLFLTFWVWYRQHTTKSTLWIEEGLWLSVGFIVVPITWFQYFIYLLAPLLYLSKIIPRCAHRPIKILWFTFLLLLVIPTGKLLPPTQQPFRTPALIMGTMYMGAWLFFVYTAHHIGNRLREHDLLAHHTPSNTSQTAPQNVQH